MRRLPFRQFFSITFFTFISKLFGFIREWSRGLFFGITDQADIFLVAYRIPLFFYKMCSEGPLSAVLVPFIYEVKHSQDQSFMMRVITCSMVIVQLLFLVLAVIIVGMSGKIVVILAPGWENSAVIIEIVSLIPLLMSSMVFMSASFYLSSVLQGGSVFSAILAQPILFNILLIIEYALCWYYNLSLYALALGYLLNAIIIFLVTLVIFRRYYAFDWRFDSKVFYASLGLIKKIAVACINVGIVEINTLIDLQFASFFGPGTLSLMSYSGVVLRIPLSVFGACLSMILLPLFSSMKNDKKLLKEYINYSFKLLILILAPITFVMYIFSQHIFLYLFRFSVDQSLQAAQYLRFSLLGLLFFCLNRVLLMVYYALGDVKTPTYLSLIAIAVNIGLNIIFSRMLGAPGIMLATSCASIIQTIFLMITLRSVHLSLR